ncbi:M14 family metallopeptidase [Francisella persica]|uniref:hypothetical protein n=1 Tax=Francisella persica TaxID=954 RepID=UPI000A8F6073|nr:hypothetical protein [Francisella persica]
MQASMHVSELKVILFFEYFKKFQPKGDVFLIPQCKIGKDVFIWAGHQGRFDSTNGDNY